MLSLRYVKEIHSRLAVRYGNTWRAKWDGLPMEAVEADWSAQLDGMQPENIRKALASLPAEFPPTASAFRALGVISEEHKPAPALPAPDPAGMLRIASELQAGHTDLPAPGEWMQRLRRDAEAGNASRVRKDHYRLALANGYYGGESAEQVGGFKPIPRDSWPESMRAA